MGGFLGELGKKLAERWLALLILPGALYLAVATTASVLGHVHALDLHRLITQVTAWAKTPVATTLGGQVVVAAAILAGAAAIGLIAQTLGSGIERLTLAAGWRTWPRPLRALAQRRRDHRRRSWISAHADYHRLYDQALQARQRTGTRLDPTDRHAAYRTRTRIAAEEPDRPTWSGDRIHAITIRLRRDLTIDLSTVWPHLWLQLPEAPRTQITTARQALTSATTLAGWALLYVPLALWWWPALPTAATLAIIAWHRIRITTDTYARFIEAATRLHIHDLATQLGIDPTGKTLPALGATLTHHLRTQTPPPPRPTLTANETAEFSKDESAPGNAPPHE